LFTMGFTISYTLDLFGANRRSIESLDALAEAQCFQLEAAYLSLASNVVAAAIQDASLRAQIEPTQRIVAAQRETLDILRRPGGGRGAPGGARVPAAAEGAGPGPHPARPPARPVARRAGRRAVPPARPHPPAGPAAQPACAARRTAARHPRRRGEPSFGQRTR